MTTIGPSEAQVEYRLTGGHGCGKAVVVDAAPLLAAVEAKAEETGSTIASLLGSAEAKRPFHRARAQQRNGSTARISGFDAVEIAAAAGIDAQALYGDAALPVRAGDGQVDYHLDATERPLVWTGNGLSEFGITNGSVLSPDQFPAARRLMRGADPRTGRTLIELKLAIDPAAKLPVAPLVRAVRRAAAERGVNPEELLDSKRKKDEFRRMAGKLGRFGESHRAPVSSLLKLAVAIGTDATELYDAESIEKALAAEADGRLDARPLLKAIEVQAGLAGKRPAELLSAASMKRRLRQLDTQAGRRLRDLPMEVREAVAIARAAGLDPYEVWDAEEVRDALLQGHVEVGNRGSDTTLDLGKSYSAFLAYAPKELAEAVEAIYTASGREAIGALEGWTAYGMRGHHGDGKEAEVVRTSGFSGWMMIHRAARPVGEAPYGDPHFHLHFTLANMVRGDDGQWSTVAAGGRDLHRHARATQAVMNARIRHDLHSQYGVTFRRDERTGAWEIAAIPEPTIRLFSKRDDQVRELLGKLGIAYDNASLKARTAASTVSKAAKNGEAAGASDDVLRAYWQAEGRAVGDDPDEISNAALGSPTDGHNPQIANICATVFDSKEGLTSHSKSFTHAAALAAVLDALPYGIADVAEAERLTTAVLQHAGYAVKLNPKGPQHYAHSDRYTTADIVAAEERIVTETTQRLNEQAAVVPRDVVDMTLSVVEKQHGPGFAFSDEQRAVLVRILTAGHGIDAVIGRAGSGKTTIMDAARQAWEVQGQVIAGASTAAVAAANLKAEAGITSRTVASWLTSVRTGGPGLRGVDVLVVDEAAMCDDRDIAELLTHAAKTGTKVVGIGDPKQLHSPGVGGHFAAVHHLVGGLELTENFRQKDAIERRALEFWRDDDRVRALRTYVSAGRVHALDDKDTTLAAMLTAWADKRAAYSDDHTAVQKLLMLAATNEVVDELNLGARAVRKINGDLTGPEFTYALAGGKELALSVGDQVLLRQNDYRSRKSGGEHEDVLNGYRGIVRAVDDQRSVLVEWREKHGTGHLDVAEWIEPDYIADGGLVLGYAITGHKSQGLTVDEALVYGPGAQANALYTMLSRNKKSTHLFLPLSVYETDTDRARNGEPATEQEHVDRAVAGLLREIETGTEERMILTELPTASVPAHLRDIVEDLPVPRAPGVREDHEEFAEGRDAPEADRDDPAHARKAGDAPMTARTTTSYAHLDAHALRDALRKSAAAARAAAREAEAAEAAAVRAEQQAAANSGPAVLALGRHEDDLAARAEAIVRLRATEHEINDRAQESVGTGDQIHRLTEQLDAVTRFGRPALRGAERTRAEEERDGLRQSVSDNDDALADLRSQRMEWAQTAGPEHEHQGVLAEAAELGDHWEESFRDAQEADLLRACSLRAAVTKKQSAAEATGHRVEGLLRELGAREGTPSQSTADRGTSLSPYATVYDPGFNSPDEHQPQQEPRDIV
ncbi:MobF family relaxase [Streptomyces sp. NPDC051561]|uniref:MobF family relaxase n=1 Tax=Streptomyces sp. NPDC051561 TaxID=3365658 RepID=UPI0037AC2D2B